MKYKHAIYFFLCNLLFLILSFSHFTIQAQPGFGIETNFFAGKVIKHTPKFTLPIPALSAAAEVNLLWQSYGKKEWQQRRGYPQLGIAFAYTNYGNDAIYGQCLGIYPNLQLPIISGKKIEWTLRLGLGLGYITRHYSHIIPGMDTENVAIGSHVNNFSLFATDLRYKLNKHWDIQTGVSLSHISDAAFRKPNLGINMVSVHFGFRYFPVTSRPGKQISYMPVLPNRWLIQARAGMAMTSSGSGGGPLYPVYLSSLYISKRYAGQNKFFAGIDYAYYSNIYAFLRNNEIFPGSERSHAKKVGVFAGAEFLYGHTGLWLQVGMYTYDPYLQVSPLYQRLGLNYYLIRQEEGAVKELFLAALLKTHFTQAEFAELGIGIGF